MPRNFDAGNKFGTGVDVRYVWDGVEVDIIVVLRNFDAGSRFGTGAGGKRGIRS